MQFRANQTGKKDSLVTELRYSLLSFACVLNLMTAVKKVKFLCPIHQNYDSKHSS